MVSGTRLLVIGLGGFLGAVLRHLAGGAAQSFSGSASFPWGTMAVNVSGCLAAGFLSQLAEDRGFPSGEARHFVFAGFLGGFTTFSAFGNETLNLLRDGQALPAGLNAAGTVLICLASVWLGRVLAYALWR